MVGAIGAGVAMSTKPWQAYREQRKIADQKIAERARAEENLVSLAEQRARLESPAGKERRAREQGFKKPSEEALEQP
ncbi:MAG TPA: hypothetical protein VM328_02015 [Fimbriimonadaceae bacterium]|nr:hypothetical protein [Fimbriimonadaceae bacterium]